MRPTSHSFARVFSAVRARDRIECVFNAVKDVLHIVTLACAKPFEKVLARHIKVFSMLEKDRTLHALAFDQKLPLHRWRLRVGLPAGYWGRTANQDTCTRIEVGHHGVTDQACRVVEIDAHAYGTGLNQSGLEILWLTGYRGVKTALVPTKPPLRLAAKDAHSFAAVQAGDLPDARANRPCCHGDHQGITSLRLPYLRQTVIGGQTVHAQHAERRRN